ncbi:hypothetical protein EDB19DRAFT_212354 [Suillus lakei]|nr:hypothetical protein EDB19DRAFT_212354 [Suillus lakei]
MSITLDDRDFSFAYDGSWFLGGQAQFEYDGTTTGTNTAGSMALFNFTGVSVSIFGTVGPINYLGQDVGAPISSYQVDDQPAVIFTAPAQGGDLYHYNFFTSPTLDNGPHQLKITNLNQSSYLWLDYVQYTPSSATSSSSSSPTTTNSQQPIPTSSSTAPKPPTNPSSSSSSLSSTLAMSSSSLSPDSQQPTTTLSSTTPGVQTDTSSSSSPVPQTSVQTTKKNNAPVIGGVIGGVVLVVAALVLIFYLRRRRNTRALVEERNVDNARLNPAEASVSEVRSIHNFSITSNAPLVGLDGWPRSSYPRSSVVPPSVMGAGSVEDSEDVAFLPRQIVDGEQGVYIHEDGGVRIAGGGLRGQVDIPPEYREYD